MALAADTQTGLLCMGVFLVFPTGLLLSELSFLFGCLHWLSCCCPSPCGASKPSPMSSLNVCFPKEPPSLVVRCAFSASDTSWAMQTKCTEGCKIDDIQSWMWLLGLSHFCYLIYRAGRRCLAMSLMAPMGKKLLIRHFDLPPFAQEMWQ